MTTKEQAAKQRLGLVDTYERLAKERVTLLADTKKAVKSLLASYTKADKKLHHEIEMVSDKAEELGMYALTFAELMDRDEALQPLDDQHEELEVDVNAVPDVLRDALTENERDAGDDDDEDYDSDDEELGDDEE